MVSGNEKLSLTSENILSLISEYDIYRFYFGYDFKFKKLYPSPFRKENNSSFNIFVRNNGSLYHMDMGNNLYKGNCFDFVKQLFGIDYNYALNKINNDFNLGLRSTIKGAGYPTSKINYKDITKGYSKPNIREILLEREEIEEKENAELGRGKTIITVIPRSYFDKDELAYWNLYDIKEPELRANNIYPIEELYINGTLIRPEILDTTPLIRFAYEFTDEEGEKYIKIYTPHSKIMKWVSNVPVKKPFGLVELPRKKKNIIIAKSKKDKIVLKKIYPEVYEVQKEGRECISEELDSFFDEFYENKYCFFDNDETGIESNKKLNSLGYKWINIPSAYGKKDPSDLIKMHWYDKNWGYRILENLLIEKGINDIYDIK